MTLTAPAQPNLVPGRVYRTHEFSAWSANPSRLAKRLVDEGKLMPLAHGLFAYPRPTKFGPAPPSEEAVVRAFLGDAPFVFTGPYYWNALGLGSTALFTVALVYNTKRSGTFSFGGHKFVFRRVAFPLKPTPEWYAIDLLENSDMAGVADDVLLHGLTTALRNKTLRAEVLLETAEQYGTRATQEVVRQSIREAQP